MRTLSAIALLSTLTTMGSVDCVRETDHPSCNDGNLLNGYYWRGYWVPGFPSIEEWYTPAPTWFYGKALRYAPGVMEATAIWRGMSLDGYLDGVALMSPGDIGEEVWLKIPGGNWEGPYLVVDCAARGDIWATILHFENTIEVGYKTALRWGMINEGKAMIRDVQVLKGNPLDIFVAPEKYDPLYNYPAWWLDMVEKTQLQEGGFIDKTSISKHFNSKEELRWN